MSEMTAAERFKLHMAGRKDNAPIVDVTAPSGFVYKFRKPSAFAMYFGMGRLPQVAASKAIEQWTEDGIVEAVQAKDPDAIALAEWSLKIREKVLELSESPKLVMGLANPIDDEISTDDVPNDDLAYLFMWVQAGGNESEMLSKFSEQQRTNAVAGTGRGKVRGKAKRTSRAAR